jgi:hypothetical protein
LNHYVADMDTYSEAQWMFGSLVAEQVGERLLNLYRALDRVYSARELGQNTVACGIGDPSPMLGD